MREGNYYKMKRTYLFNLVIIAFLLSNCNKPKEAQSPDNINTSLPSAPLYDPANLSVPLNTLQVTGCFNFVAKKNVHPRIIFDAADISRIVINKISDPVLQDAYNDLLTKADDVLSKSIPNYGLDQAGLRITAIHTIANDYLPYLVLAYQFTKNSRYAIRSVELFEKMCTFSDWGANRHFLDAGIAAKAFALIYDGLYDYLTPAQRTKYYIAVKDFVLQPGKSQIENNTGVFKWYQTNNNWNGICHGGMIMAALAAYEMDSSFNSSVIALSANGMLNYIKSFDPDGASEEGLSYWAYGLSNTFLSLEALKRCLGSTFGLTNQPGFKKTGMFPYLVSGPVGSASFGDDYIYAGKEYRFLSFCWFSHFYNDAGMANTHFSVCKSVNSNKSNKLNGWTDLLYYNKNLIDQGNVLKLYTSGYVKGVDYMYLSESTSDVNAMYIGMHSGDNKASHGHLDAGTFFLQSLGENWAQGNLGLESPYPADYFTVTKPSYLDPANTPATAKGRYYYFRVKTEGKNCLVFNPDARPEQNPDGVASMINEGNDDKAGFYVADLSSCYNRDVTTYKRGIKLNRNSKIVTIQDEFIPKQNGITYWIMHSSAIDGAMLSADGKIAKLTKNGKILYARIISPTNAVFQIVDRSANAINYLPETAVFFQQIMNGFNTPNTWYGKLQIKLNDVKAGSANTIRVDFLNNENTELMPLTALEGWTTTN